MADFIDRKKIFPNGVFFANENDPWASLDKLIDRVWSIPTADVVEVVRCKDCKHRRDDEDFASGHYCAKRPQNGGYFCEDDDFCSYGERRYNNA